LGVAGFTILMGLIVLFIIPGWAVDRAARNDARLAQRTVPLDWRDHESRVHALSRLQPARGQAR
jgi:hypothetical protein